MNEARGIFLRLCIRPKHDSTRRRKRAAASCDEERRTIMFFNWRIGAKPLRSTYRYSTLLLLEAYLAEHLHRGTLVPSVGCLSSLVGRPPISSVFSIRYVDPPCAFRLPCRCVDVGGNPGGMEGPTVEGTEESPDRCRARGQDGPRRANGECCFYFPCRVPTFECRNK